MNNENIASQPKAALDIEAAERHAGFYDGDDRKGIKSDVLNAFYAGLRYARRAPADQAASVALSKPVQDAAAVWDSALEEAAHKITGGNDQVRDNGWIDCANERARCAKAIRSLKRGMPRSSVIAAEGQVSAAAPMSMEQVLDFLQPDFITEYAAKALKNGDMVSFNLFHLSNILNRIRASEGQAQTSAAVDWRSACESVIDIWDDAQKNPPESRCYMEGAWPALLDEIRTDLAAQSADKPAKEQS